VGAARKLNKSVPKRARGTGTKNGQRNSYLKKKKKNGKEGKQLSRTGVDRQRSRGGAVKKKWSIDNEKVQSGKKDRKVRSGEYLQLGGGEGSEGSRGGESHIR